MRKILLTISACFIVVLLTSFFDKIISAETPLANTLSGRILLQVEKNGEAWYVNPDNLKRYFLGRPDDAFSLMRELGVGISDDNINKIEIALENISGADTDDDGLSDKFEEAVGTLYNNPDTDGDGHSDLTEIANGYNPRGAGKINIDNNFAKSVAGKIYIQVEKNGEAWYINPIDLKRYYLGSPQDAFNLMRKLALGISDIDIFRIEENNNEDSLENKTEEIDNNETVKKYSDKFFEFNYPIDWTIKNFSDDPNTIMITDSEKDYYLEKKAVIIVSYIYKSEGAELDNFNIASKAGASKTIDKKIQINGLNALEQAFYYDQTYERQIILQKNSKTFLSMIFITANNNSYYKKIFEDLYNNLTFK